MDSLPLSYTQKSPASFDVGDSYKKVAATYSPTWWGSTIGDGELNFSVRNGKRWILAAITATVYVLRKNNQIKQISSPSVVTCQGLFLIIPVPPYACFYTLRRAKERQQRKMSGY